MYDFILFDLDGTVTDSQEGIINCLKYALKNMGIDEQNYDNLKRFIGPPLIDGFMQYYNLTEIEAKRALGFYRERYSAEGIFQNKLYSGIEIMLQKLKASGKKTALATSKPHIYAEKILKHFNIFDYFDILVGAELDGTRNDKAEVIAEALRAAQHPKNSVMVGDRFYDIVGAKQNNIQCIGVTYGFAKEGELEYYGADKIVSSVEELCELLLEN